MPGAVGPQPAPTSRARRGARTLGSAVLAACLTAAATGCEVDGEALLKGREPSPETEVDGNANTAEVVAAADAFLDTLAEEQRSEVLHEFRDGAKRTGWSYVPFDYLRRNGLALADMDGEQKEAALTVMRAALSEQGFRQLQGIRAADGRLASIEEARERDGASPEAEGPEYGADLYAIAFFGDPDETSEFMIQFGGHHLAYNLTYGGGDVSMSPTLTAVEPVEFEWEGRSYAPLADSQEATLDAVAALTAEQRTAAEIGSENEDGFDHLALGPGDSGPYPAPKGIVVAELTEEQQDLVTAMMRTWVDDMDTESAERLVAKYVSEYDRTYLGWNGATDADDVKTYVRLQGPSVWIEYANRPDRVLDGVHPHTVFRDRTSDYGWT
ncbi:DUF3500 domain-containing protein [Nocardiopsis sp. CNT312]|uniref:DUF3500 domain-containing protein n=1 Tax=Nocardiopsis sp. CNT312 TaxID=1137268 RepID=UPI0004B587EB|nr:DUF3500 domain-containing protein [Nocardiopsis sp. CNT312]